MNIIISNPNMVTLDIGLTITFVIGTAIGMLDYSQSITPRHQQYFCYRGDECEQASQGYQ
jgi:hypothetical protein